MLPAAISTPRLRLVRWDPAHAARLKEALDESARHLRGWIPRTVAESGPVPQLEARLRAYVASFDAGREWLFAVFRADAGRLVGGVSLHPRTAAMRVPAAEADRVEIGYWLRRTATGHGFVTEAADGLLALTPGLPGHGHVELRCDPRNGPSIAVARRLGFRHVGDVPRPPGGEADVPDLMIWERRPAGDGLGDQGSAAAVHQFLR
jgi:ribosomal-protein-serine acetyltransferase